MHFPLRDPPGELDKLIAIANRGYTATHLETRDRKILYKPARSASIWERRIAVIATFHFIDQHQFEDAFKLTMLLDDEEYLIHEAVGCP